MTNGFFRGTFMVTNSFWNIKNSIPHNFQKNTSTLITHNLFAQDVLKT